MSDKEAKFQAILDAEEAESKPAGNEKFDAIIAAEQAEKREKLTNPLLWGAVGMTALALNRNPASVLRKYGIDVPKEVAAGGPDSIRKWFNQMVTTPGAFKGGESFEEAYRLGYTEPKKAAEDLAKKVAEMNAKAPQGYRFDPDANSYLPEAEVAMRDEQRARQAAQQRMQAEEAARRERPFAERNPRMGAIGKEASIIGRQLVPSRLDRLGRPAAGAFGGYSAAEAYNKGLVENDIPGAAISGAGTVGSALALSPRPKTKALGLGMMGLSGAGSYLTGNDQERPDFRDTAKSVMDVFNKASGGSVPGYAAGKKVLETAIGKSPAGLEFVKRLAGKESPSLWEKYGYDPKKIASQYPDVLPPVEKVDPKSGKSYLAKQLSPEAMAVQKARQAAQKEIDTGAPSYRPYFDITKRSYVDPANYPMPDKTLELTMPKKAETLEKHRALAQSPEATARLESAYEAASGSPTAHGFYMMKQLEDEYVKELGPELGRQAFRTDFALPMAATTGGQTPTANYMMTAMHNYFANKGLPIPSKGYDIPYPVGGNKLQSNIDKSQELFQTGVLSAAESPKRYNFASNFMGHSDRPTIDEQMMGLFNPGGKGAPDWYGVNEEAVNQLAKKRGVEPVNYQEVAWAGAKGYPGQPMIEDINQSIYRTHRMTGMPQEEVVKRNLIRKLGPMYGVTGLGVLGTDHGLNNPD